MARASPLFTSFNAGEWSPLLHGRPDLGKYRGATRTCRNMIPLPQGAATRRPGTSHVAPTKNDGVARLVAFVFSTVQAYAIEMGDLYFRFFKDRGQIESSPGVPYEIVSPYAAAQIAAVKWTQSADILYLCHPAARPKELTRTGHTNWAVANFAFRDGPYLEVNTDAAKTLAPSATTGAITITAAGHAPFAATDVGRLARILHASTWGNAEITGFTSSTVVNATVKSAFGAATAQPAWRLGAWSDTTGWPSCVTFHEERLWFAATTAQPQTLWGSRSGDFTNMAPTNVDGTVPDDAAIAITVADDQVNAIHWLAAGSRLLIGTSGGEKVLQASSLNEAITPANVTVRPQSSHGSADLMPVRIDLATLYIQRVRRSLHEMAYSFEADSFVSPEMSVLATHLTRPRLAALAYQPTPWGVLWAPRDDGVLLGFTYLREQEVLGWHHHRIGGRLGTLAWGKALSVAVVPAAEQDELWAIVERTINGATRRYVEVMGDEFWADLDDADQAVLDQEDAVFVDSALVYDGWNADPTKTLRLHGAGAWNSGDTKTMTAVGHAPFAVASIGKEYRFRKKGTVFPAVPVEITEFASASQVTARLLRAAPAALQDVAVDWWGLAATTLSGLGHLEGETVQVAADGGEHPDKTVAGGAIALERPAAKAVVGLGAPARLETLDLDAGSATGTAKGKPMRVSEATVLFFQTLGAKAGYDDAHLERIPFRAGGDAMDEPPPLFTGDKRVIWPKGFDRGQRLLAVQDRPLPMTVCAVAADIVTVD